MIEICAKIEVLFKTTKFSNLLISYNYVIKVNVVGKREKYLGIANTTRNYF